MAAKPLEHEVHDCTANAFKFAKRAKCLSRATKVLVDVGALLTSCLEAACTWSSKQSKHVAGGQERRALG